MKEKLLFLFFLGIMVLSSTEVYGLREIEGNGSSLSPIVLQEHSLKEKIIRERREKGYSETRSPVKPLPKSRPMPGKKEYKSARALNSPSVRPLTDPSSPASISSSRQEVVDAVSAGNAERKSKEKKTPKGGVIFFVLLSAIVFFVWKKTKVPNNRGSSLIMIALLIMLILIIGGSLVFISQNELTKKTKSKKELEALYIADGGIEKALWEINRNEDYAGEENVLLGSGLYTVTVSTPGGMPNQREIISTATVNTVKKKIKVVAEKALGDIAVNSALGCGGDVKIGGSATVDGGTLTGVVAPAGSSIDTSGGGAVTGSPPTDTAPFPTLEDVFGVPAEEIEGMATTKYVNPPNDAACSEITWVTGDLKVSSNGWSGTGILIVNGNFEITGGIFRGVVYVTGTFKMAGNVMIQGGVFAQSTADITAITGTATLQYDVTAIEGANALYPFKIISWQEVKN